jgi:hypothetical protein
MFDYKKNKHLVCDSTGRRLTAGLFIEWDNPTAPFSLKEWRETYVRISDPTGYKAAMELIGDWEHWQLLEANKRFATELEDWNKQVAVKLSSEAIESLVAHSKEKHGVAAAKWLAEHGFVLKNNKRRKEQQESEDSLDKEIKKNVAADAKRLGLTVVSR